MRLLVLGILVIACSGVAEAGDRPTTSAGASSGCHWTRTTDASGVMTTDGLVGIVGPTYASSSAVNDLLLMVRRGVVLGDRVTVRFQQLGAGAPATWVEYSVAASERKTPWGDLAFPLGVKPIGFPNSCWRVLVDGSDSGIILAIGP